MPEPLPFCVTAESCLGLSRVVEFLSSRLNILKLLEYNQGSLREKKEIDRNSCRIKANSQFSQLFSGKNVLYSSTLSSQICGPAC